MTTVLVDVHMEGQALVPWGILASDGWVELLDLRLLTFAGAGLPRRTADREVWRFAQANAMLLLANNRNAEGDDSLERTITAESRLDSLPVLTVGSLDRLGEHDYRRRCAARILEIVVDLDNYRGTGRVFIP